MITNHSSTPFLLSEAALQALKRLWTEKNISAEYCIRVGIKPGQSGEKRYLLGFDLPKESDLRFVQDEMNFIVDRRHSMQVVGKHIDFKTSDGKSGFVFKDPPLSPEIPKKDV